ncbi:MAG: hypothetical protein HND57_14115 [Planctomycetes bacterium]|nr:hypothetical protein [Planctomycetota bacterium]
MTNRLTPGCISCCVVLASLPLMSATAPCSSTDDTTVYRATVTLKSGVTLNNVRMNFDPQFPDTSQDDMFAVRLAGGSSLFLRPTQLTSLTSSQEHRIETRDGSVVNFETFEYQAGSGWGTKTAEGRVYVLSASLSSRSLIGLEDIVDITFEQLPIKDCPECDGSYWHPSWKYCPIDGKPLVKQEQAEN